MLFRCSIKSYILGLLCHLKTLRSATQSKRLLCLHGSHGNYFISLIASVCLPLIASYCQIQLHNETQSQKSSFHGSVFPDCLFSIWLKPLSNETKAIFCGYQQDLILLNSLPNAKTHHLYGFISLTWILMSVKKHFFLIINSTFHLFGFGKEAGLRRGKGGQKWVVKKNRWSDTRSDLDF